MLINIVEEAGHKSAVTGMRFSHQVETKTLDFEEAAYPNTKVTRTLAMQDGGHNKFLESMMVWVDIKAPLYFWKQFDTYRIGVTKQSKSTMHSLMKQDLTADDFVPGVYWDTIARLNRSRARGDFNDIISNLPDGYLQTRRVCLSYKAIRTMCLQRKVHKLSEWKYFCTYMQDNLEHGALLGVDIV